LHEIIITNAFKKTYRVNQPDNKLKFLFLAVCILLVLPLQAYGYIGPGAGFAVVGSFLVMFTVLISAVLAVFTWPVRYLIRSIRGRHAFAHSRVSKLVILGLDGLDPNLAEKFMAQGRLPNFSRLAKLGCFKRLATTVPSISPVAWSSFQTGTNPGKHNIFDFLTRDRQSYLPKLSSVDIRPPRRYLSLGKYRWPLGRADIRLLRKSMPFWKVLGRHGIFSDIIRVPITFPPEKFHGVQLSAMCVPDLRGTQGMFSFYTTAAPGVSEPTGGEFFRVHKNGKTIKALLVGPENPFRRDKQILQCPFEVTIKDEKSAELRLNGSKYLLSKGIYSDWIKIVFKTGIGVKVCGIGKFLLLTAQPELKLYVSPINIDPGKPAMPISYPAIYSMYLAKRQKSFATLGLAEDSWALNEKVISDEDFIRQCIDFDIEREKMFFDSLQKVKQGLCVCVFDGTDRIQHTFWRDFDAEHPANREHPRGQRAGNAVEELYQRADVLVGKTLDKCEQEEALLLVISDHGFNKFCYGVDLNRWLEENGYLKLKEDGRGKKNLAGVDWSGTRAYAIGLAGIYLNLQGREAQGIVEPTAEATKLRREIAAKLAELVNPLDNQPAVKQVYIAPEIYKGPYKNEAPDLLVGYHKGCRASWQTAIGEVTDKIFYDNTKAWSGDHCIDPSLVPGVLFCNRPISTDNPRMIDIAPTVLEMFGVDVPDYMDGKPLTVVDTKADQTQPEIVNGIKN